jgi:hypothetical protein
MALEQNLTKSANLSAICQAGVFAAGQSDDLPVDCRSDDLPMVCQSDDLQPAIVAPVVVDVQCSSAIQASNEGKGSMSMEIVTGGMQFRLDTVVDHSREALALAAKLELALTLLSLSENKLENAMIVIGQLQMRLKLMEPISNES